MKKLLLTSLIIMCVGSALAQTAGPLPAAHKTNGMPLMQALNERKTTRSFSDQTIDEATLADILWAAVGVNKDGNKRTIPTALNRQNISVYVLSANGAFLYVYIAPHFSTSICLFLSMSITRHFFQTG